MVLQTILAAHESYAAQNIAGGCIFIAQKMTEKLSKTPNQGVKCFKCFLFEASCMAKYFFSAVKLS